MTCLLACPGRQLTPLLSLFLHLGLKRVWYQSGDFVFQQGDQCRGLYVAISGRIRTFARRKHGARPMESSDSDSESEEEEDEDRGNVRNDPADVHRVDVGRCEFHQAFHLSCSRNTAQHNTTQHNTTQHTIGCLHMGDWDQRSQFVVVSRNLIVLCHVNLHHLRPGPEARLSAS